MNIAKFLLPCLLVAGVAFSATRSDLKVGNRTAIVYNPTGYKNPPLVISMHGMGIPASMNQGMMMFERYADTAKEKFITVYPQGIDSRWDLGGNTDINFILAIIDSMVKRYGVDRNRVYATGFSMGGMMSWYLSCKIPDKIAAIVPDDGYPMGGMSGCSEVRHVPVLHIHGTADDFVSYANFVNSFNPAQLTRYGCPNKVTIKPYPANKPNSQSFKDVWSPCVKNGLKSEINLIHVTGMIHDWATPGKMNANDDPKFKGKSFDIDGTQEAWNWMKLQSLNGSVGVGDRASHASKTPVISARYTGGEIRVESDRDLGAIELINLRGQILLSADAKASSVDVPAKHIPRGIYVLNAKTSEGVAAARVVVP